LSARPMRTILLGAWALWCVACATTTCNAATPGATAAGASPRPQSARERPLTRSDIDLMLREARSAIKQGKLDEAEKILARAEGAHVHYSLLHFGATPSTVRRELERARRSPGATSQAPENAVAADSANPFSGKKATATPPSDVNVPRRDIGSALIMAGQQPGERIASNEGVENPFGRQPSAKERVANPFAQAEERAVAPARYETTEARGGVERAAWQQEAAAAPLAPIAASQPATTPVAANQSPANPSWALPNAQPATAGTDRYAVTAANPIALTLRPALHCQPRRLPASPKSRCRRSKKPCRI
jgi:hypothetical protein